MLHVTETVAHGLGAILENRKKVSILKNRKSFQRKT